MKREEILVLITGLLGIFVGLGLARFAYTVILEPMRAGLELGYTEMGTIASLNFFGYVLFSPVVGILATKYGSKKVVLGSMAIIVVSLYLTSLSRGFVDAGVYRFLTGAGSAGVNVGLVGLMAKWFDERSRGFALGVINSGSSWGIIFAGATIPYVVLSYGWNAGWVFLSVISLFVLLMLLPLKEVPSDFVPEVKVKSGDVYRHKPLIVLGISYVFFGASYIIFVTFYTSHIIKNGIGYEVAGHLWAIVGVLSIVSAITWGRISDKIGRKQAISAVYLLMGSAFLVFALASSLGFFLISTLMAGLSMLAIPPLVQAYCGDIAGKNSASAAIGFVTLFFGIGQMFGPGVAGFLADLTGDFVLPLALAGTLGIAGGIVVRKT
ncbi:MFS transporter [Geoglobus acetivorans]|uniref:YbfB/YjiJ family MFS transporter n=1 Tax=Geoglobus acetivorans TaxID=565033 RepID=A0ABZ3H1F6_GEOAI|nr:YbfB/YjiJ family MFS transporter [Geoglobus acetivorans]